MGDFLKSEFFRGVLGRRGVMARRPGGFGPLRQEGRHILDIEAFFDRVVGLVS